MITCLSFIGNGVILSFWEFSLVAGLECMRGLKEKAGLIENWSNDFKKIRVAIGRPQQHEQHEYTS
ncbi:protein of unknown function [Paenibacillus alvei]|uniref:Uncharacterized protein n=1 Tax=Paenibacillus alvei TaxID=44250 RepID=A0A383R9T7_PAEAL|nr:protein of unknown function [Paenibacillus alvei]